jgi:neutral ceramidase
LWLHGDLLALDQGLVDRWRSGLEAELGIPVSRILISTPHTHSGPATIQLTGCGEVRPAYITQLQEQVRCAAQAALCDLEFCHILTVQGSCKLGVDRRESDSAHTDPRVGAVAWQRQDGIFKAVFPDYAMQPVCLRSSLISGDWPGEVARLLSQSLPGGPVTIVSSGACANINPPGVGVSPEQMREWSNQVAESVRPLLLSARHHENHSRKQTLRVATASLPLPLET